MRTGILGGAFDPIHNGHVYMAQKAMQEYSLDRVIFVPSGHSPNKTEQNMTSFEHRFRMCELAALSDKTFEVSDIEIQDKSTSYTYMTLLKFKELNPNDELFFIMGGDSLDYFDEWRNPDIIAATAVLLVVVREDFPVERLRQKIDRIKSLFAADIRLLRCKQIDVSSTQVRGLLKGNKEAAKLLDPKVLEYIESNNLYR